MDHERGIQQLLELLGADHTRYTEVLTLQGRLAENVKSERIFGSTETIRAERAQIIYALNTIARDELKMTFNDLAIGRPANPTTPTQQPGERTSGPTNNPAMPPPAQEIDPRAIREALLTWFNSDELRILCADHGVDWEDLEGRTISIKALSLVDYFRRRNSLPALVASIRKLRPGAI